MVALIIFILLVLVSVLFFIAAGYPISETILAYFNYGIEKLKHLFSKGEAPSPPVLTFPPKPDNHIPLPSEQQAPSTSANLESPDSDSSDSDSDSDSDEDEGKKPPKLNQSLEVEMSKAVALPPSVTIAKPARNLDTVIETPSTTPYAREAPLPIDEYDVPENNNGWCYIGESKGARGCAPVGKMDKCITGEVYVNQMECLKIHPENAPKPPGPYDAYYQNQNQNP
jgi:hypothetical protein